MILKINQSIKEAETTLLSAGAASEQMGSGVPCLREVRMLMEMFWKLSVHKV